LTVPTSTYIGKIKRLCKTNNWDVETYRIKLEKGFNEFGIASVQGLQNITYLLKFVIFKSKIYISKFDIFSKMVTYVHCSVIIGRNLIEANANTGEIQQPLPGNPLATIGNPLAIIGKFPTIGKLTIEAKGFSGRG
jgi:hypothetical protein